MRRSAGGGGFGPAPITDQVVINWEQRSGYRLEKWEEQAIFRIDDEYLASAAAEAAKAAKRKPT